MTGKKTVVDALRFLAEVGLAKFREQGLDLGAILGKLLTRPVNVVNWDGCGWFQDITWPDRAPDLKTWTGQMTLYGLIGKLQKPLQKAHKEARIESEEDLLRFEAPLKGVSGFDYAAAADPIDIGFSPAALGMPIIQKPGQELLAIYALEELPLVSFSAPRSRRRCGFLHEGSCYEMAVEARAGGYYHRWGPLTVHGVETY